MAVMSTERSSSAVRNLRVIFETKESEAVAQGQKSRSGSVEPSREGRRPLSKVRSNFVAVESGRTMEDTTQHDRDRLEEHEGDEVTATESSASLRRASFSANANESEELELKRVVTHESEKRERDKAVQETVPEQAIESSPDGTPRLQPQGTTPGLKPAEENVKPSTAAVADAPLPPANPDKPVTGVEEEPGSLKPADLTSLAAVSGGDAMNTPEPTTAPSAPLATTPSSPGVAQEAPVRTVPNAKTSQPGPKQSPRNTGPAPTKADSKSASKPLNRKASRSLLAAGTTSATAHTAASSEPMPARPKPRETSKPVEISSHLLAPTAASRARQEGEHAPSNGMATKKDRSPRASLAMKATPRSSLAGRSRPDSSNDKPALRKPPVPAPDESFLERMMRPTAASQNRVTGKYESKSPPRKSRPITSALKKVAAAVTPGDSSDAK